MENILIVGRGKTSRANIDALMTDYYKSHKNVTLHVIDPEKLTESHDWIIQHADDAGIDVVLYVGDVAVPKLDNASMFILWDDEDPRCQASVVFAKEHNMPVFDLTNGLYTIHIPDSVPPVVTPKMPPEELVDEPDDDEYDSDDDEGVYDAIDTLIEYFADIVADKVLERLQEGRQ